MKFLFEIGVEELPSRYVDKSNELLSNFKKELLNERIAFNNEKVYNSPRRMAFSIEIADMQQDLYEKKVGPSKESCYNNGQLTKAALGFLKSQNLEEKDMKFEITDKGEYLFVEKNEKGKSSLEVLSKILDKSIRNLEFDKTMKWSNKTFRFARPIKWLLALVDNKVFDFEFEGIKSSNITRGMRLYASQNILINNIDDYEKILEENFVIVNPEKRRKMILDSVKQNCENDGDKAIINDYLLNEVVNIVEYPYAIKGEFNKNYLLLPEQIITITMETHQRYFPVRDSNGKLTNKFIVIRNAPEYSEMVKKGNEKVIEPRLADAKFFYDEDLKINLEKNVEKLKNITFQKDMGSIYDKVLRAKEIAKYLNANEDTLRTLELCKADLVSNVISEKEFTSLQGMMGGIYAKNSGEKDVVSKAIPEHYMPRFQGDTLPISIEGAISAISDKLDTAIGAFCVGLKPTSSKDPYAIRRATQGICVIALDKKLDVDYLKLIEKAYSIFVNDKKLIYEKALADFKEFFKQRLETVLAEKYSKTLISYVINIEFNFKNILEKLEKLSKVSNLDNLINILKRMKNIVKDNSFVEIKKELLTNEYEKNLLSLYENLLGKDFSSSIDILLENENKINDFFANVKINTEDENISKNRLALLNNILIILGNIVEI